MTEKNGSFNRSSTIHTRHYEEWEASGVNAEIIDRNVRTLEDSQEIDRYLSRNTSNRWKHSEIGPGWLVTGVDPLNGQINYLGLQFKPDKPSIDSRGETTKYLTASGYPAEPLFLDIGAECYWPSILANPSREIVITEGAKKAGCCLTKRIPAISLPGVACGQKHGKLKESLRKFCHPQRIFYLAFDSDLTSNRNVKRELQRLGTLLEKEGGSVRIMLWDSDWKGIDDYLVAHDEPGVIAALMKNAKPLKDWQESIKPKPEEVTLNDYHLILDALDGKLRYNLLSNDVEMNGQPFDVGNAKVHLRVDHGVPVRSGNDDASVLLLKAAKASAYHPVGGVLDLLG